MLVGAAGFSGDAAQDDEARGDDGSLLDGVDDIFRAFEGAGAEEWKMSERVKTATQNKGLPVWLSDTLGC